MVILVDMDDVIERLVAGWVAYINERFGTNVTPEDVHNWDLTSAFPTLTKEQVYSATLDDALWDYVKPMPDADTYLRKLLEDGHEIFIVTATQYQTLKAKMEKVLFRYFPYIDWNHVIITQQKYLINGDVLVDDAPHNFLKGPYKKILFTAHHNLNFDASSVGALRADNWKEVYEYISEMESTYENR